MSLDQEMEDLTEKQRAIKFFTDMKPGSHFCGVYYDDEREALKFVATGEMTLSQLHFMLSKVTSQLLSM